MAKKQPTAKAEAAQAAPPRRRLSYVDELRQQRLPQAEGETRLMYARRKAGWPPLKQ